MDSQFPPGESFSAISKQSGFNFSLYKGRVDWKKLGAVDVDRLISEKDLELLSDLLRNVTNLNLESDFDVKVLDPDFVKLFRLAQLSVDFLLHCKSYLENCLYDSQHKLNVAVKEVKSLRHICEETKYELKRAKKHLREHQAQSNHASLLQTSHKCHLCGKAFIEEAYLQSHLRRRHPDHLPPESNDSTQTAAMLRTEIKQLKERLNFAELQLNKRFEETSPRLANEEVENETSSIKEDVMALRNLLQSEIKKLKENGKQDKSDHSTKTQDVQSIPAKNTKEVSTNTDTFNEQENLANLLARFLSNAQHIGSGDNGLQSNNIRKTREIPDNFENSNYNDEKSTLQYNNTEERIPESSKSHVASEEGTVEPQITQSSQNERDEDMELQEVESTKTSSKITPDRITMVTPKNSITEDVGDAISSKHQNPTENVSDVVNNADLREKLEGVLRNRKSTVTLRATKSRTFSMIECEDASASESDLKTAPVAKDSGSRVDNVVPLLEPPKPKPRSKPGSKSQSSDGSTSEVEKVVKDLEVHSISSAEDGKDSEVEAKVVTRKQPPLQKRGLFSQKSVWHNDVLEESDREEPLQQGDGRKAPDIVISQFSEELKTSNPQRTPLFATSEVTEFVQETSSDLDESVRNFPIEKVHVIDKSALSKNSVLSSSVGSSRNEDHSRDPIETAMTRKTDETDKKDAGNMFGTPLNKKRDSTTITDNADIPQMKNDKSQQQFVTEKQRQDAEDSALILADCDSVGANVSVDSVGANVQLLLATNPEILQALRSDLENMLGRRLRDLGIDPEWTQLPDKTYRDKKAALDHHKNIVAKSTF
ncbi:zinc finger protein DZIP1L isoform X2 [Nilaparvata lugens]|uniref:zinc finger protein DZIP1L isoform X2 n=1 Tax=Nilaparvata lugens TaxID=108931 RepID=UPI00193D03DE|nr:zinc finger protein DZIP1L isoform X2 [Nilaparvata lugens]